MPLVVFLRFIVYHGGACTLAGVGLRGGGRRAFLGGRPSPRWLWVDLVRSVLACVPVWLCCGAANKG